MGSIIVFTRSQYYRSLIERIRYTQARGIAFLNVQAGICRHEFSVSSTRIDAAHQG